MEDGNNDVVVIGIDPAPSKPTVVCTDFSCEKQEIVPPYFEEWPAYEVKTKLQAWCKAASDKNKRILITWDAPLTGPASIGGVAGWSGEFTQRIIESFFMTVKHKKNVSHEQNIKEQNELLFNNNTVRKYVPKGVSIQGYSTCQHWTLTKQTLGLPIIGEFDKEPFAKLAEMEGSLCTKYDKILNKQCLVAEVHPALALWLWINEPLISEDDWIYKGNKEKVVSLYNKIVKIFEDKKQFTIEARQIKSDDRLDAWVAWLLGRLWVDKGGGVRLVGSLATGAMLLPCGEIIAEKFQLFIEAHKKSMAKNMQKQKNNKTTC